MKCPHCHKHIRQMLGSTHWKTTRYGEVVAECGLRTKRVTTERAKVECKSCLKRMKTRDLVEGWAE